MAVDTPLIRDGGLMTANATFLTGLAGPGATGQFLAVVVSASKVVSIASSPTAGPIYGVLQNTPIAGEPCDIGILGATKMVSGAAIPAGAELMVDSSGRFIQWTAGSANFKVGMCLETVAAINNIFTGMVYMPSYKVVT